MANTRHRLFDDCLREVDRAFAALDIVDQREPAQAARDALATPALIISFLNERILRGPDLNLPNINFHPAPPEYPGRGSASYALFEEADTFGATAHRMVDAVDAGEILLVEEFPIGDDATCEDVFARGEDACLTLLRRTVDFIVTEGSLPPPCGRQWRRQATTRREFDEWLILDPDDEDAFHRKIRAARHPRFPGPYVRVHGHLFSFVDETDSSD
jgi:methionyl-tRNA formyltransferase